MKKARELWVSRSRCTGDMYIHEKESDTWNTEFLNHDIAQYREVLDPDPKDEVIKIMIDALIFYAEATENMNVSIYDCLGNDKGKIARKALAAVEKLEKQEPKIVQTLCHHNKTDPNFCTECGVIW